MDNGYIRMWSDLKYVVSISQSLGLSSAYNLLSWFCFLPVINLSLLLTIFSQLNPYWRCSFFLGVPSFERSSTHHFTSCLFFFSKERKANSGPCGDRTNNLGIISIML